MKPPRTLRLLLCRYRLSAWEAEHRPGLNVMGETPVPLDPEWVRFYLEDARRHHEMAVRMIARASRRQVMRWLQNKCPYLRGFVIEHLGAA